MKRSNGYILLHRKMTEWEWYKDIPVCHLFNHLLLIALYDEYEYKGINYPAGTVITTVKDLAFETGLTVKQVRRAIEKLEKTSEICTKRTNKFTVINIVNWGIYQVSNIETGQTKGKQRANKGQTKCSDTYYKKKKEINKEVYYNAHTRKDKNDFGAFDLDAFEERLNGD